MTANTNETFSGFVATGAGRTSVSLTFAGDECELNVTSQWMGDAAPLDVTLRCRRVASGSHSGALVVAGAKDGRSGEELALPPSDGDLLLEYVRVPPQNADLAGSGEMRAAGRWTTRFTVVVWLHPDAAFDDGTELAPEEYDVPPARFRAAARALKWLVRPWKLG